MQILLRGITQKIFNSINDLGELSLSDPVTPRLIYLIMLFLFKIFQWLFMLFSLPEAPEGGKFVKTKWSID